MIMHSIKIYGLLCHRIIKHNNYINDTKYSAKIKYNGSEIICCHCSNCLVKQRQNNSSSTVLSYRLLLDSELQ